jgi:predicted nucleotidyltransferase
MKLNTVNIPEQELTDFCRRNHIRKLSLYGSILHENFRPDSDVDVLVEFESGHTVGYITLAGFEIDLSKMIGRKVDLRTPGELSPYFRDEVLREAKLLCPARRSRR